MTGTLCRSAAPGRIIAPWPAKIAAFLHAIVETILTIAEIVRTILHESMGRLRRRTGRPAAFGARCMALSGRPAPARITDNRKVALDVSLQLRCAKARQAPSPQVVPDRSRESMVPMARDSSWISKSLRVTIRVAGGGHVRT